MEYSITCRIFFFYATYRAPLPGAAATHLHDERFGSQIMAVKMPVY